MCVHACINKALKNAVNVHYSYLCLINNYLSELKIRPTYLLFTDNFIIKLFTVLIVLACMVIVFFVAILYLLSYKLHLKISHYAL